jgi:hypothetical protein
MMPFAYLTYCGVAAQAPVSVQAHIGAADVKPRSGGRSQNRCLMRGKRQ